MNERGLGGAYGAEFKWKPPKVDIESSHETAPVRNSVVVAKLKRRRDSGKPLDVLISDIDGTLYTRTPDGIHVGKNADTARQLKEKDIPFIVNTGRSVWDSNSDRDIGSYGLPGPDAVVAGAGTTVYWRQKDGTLRFDEAYAELLRHQKISYEVDGVVRTAEFDPGMVADLLSDCLRPYRESGQLVRSIANRGPVLSNGAVATDGFRMVLAGIGYDDLKKLVGEMKHRVSGIKADICEDLGTGGADTFTGWVDVVPLSAGKEGGAKYVLGKIGEEIDHADRKIQAHIVGDASNDIRVLASGTDDEAGSFVLNQYSLNNAPRHTRSKLEAVARVSAKHKAGPHAHLTVLGGNGPDGVHEIVSALA